MARVPTQPLPTVAPSTAPLGGFTQRATPDAFGAAVARGEGQLAGAEGQLSGTLGRAADQQFQVAMAAQDLQNETLAKDADVKATRAANDVLFNPESGYFAKMGRDAIDAYQPTMDALEKVRQDALDSLPNERTRNLFDQVFVRKLGTLQGSVGSHAQQQRKVWMAGTTDAEIDATVSNGVNFANDDKLWGQTEQTVKNYVLQKGELQGWSPEQVGAAQNQAVSKAWGLRLQRIATDDPVKALDLYRANIAKITGPDQVAIGRKLETLALPVQTRQLANRVMSGQGTPDVDALTTAVIGQESGGVYDAVSGKGALGIMQLMPDTAKDVAAKLGVPFDPDKLLNDPQYNKMLGTAYLNQMLARYGGDQTLALAAYNAGPGRVDRWLTLLGDPTKGEISDADFAAKIPIAETRDYVAAINAKVPTRAGTMPTDADVRAHLGDWLQAARTTAQQIFPNRPEAVDQTVSHVLTYAGQIERGNAFQQKAARDALLTSALGLVATPAGTYTQSPALQRPTSLEQLLAQPAAREAWATSDALTQSAILSVLQQNARHQDPPMTEAALAKYYELKGLAGRDATAFLNVNLADKSIVELLPHNLSIDLMNEQAQLSTRAARDAAKGENMLHAASVAAPMLRAAGIAIPTKPGEKAQVYDQFLGRLQGALDQFQTEHKRLPNDSEIRSTAQSLLTLGAQAGSGWIFGDKTVRAFQVPPAQFYVPVPTAEKPKIIADFRQIKGRDPTAREIAEIYTAHALNGGGAP